MPKDNEDHVLTISTAVLNATGLCAVMAFANGYAASQVQHWNSGAILWTGNLVFGLLIAALAWVAFVRLVALTLRWSAERLPQWSIHWIAGLFTLVVFSTALYVAWSVSGALAALAT